MGNDVATMRRKIARLEEELATEKELNSLSQPNSFGDSFQEVRLQHDWIDKHGEHFYLNSLSYFFFPYFIVIFFFGAFEQHQVLAHELRIMGDAYESKLAALRREYEHKLKEVYCVIASWPRGAKRINQSIQSLIPSFLTLFNRLHVIINCRAGPRYHEGDERHRAK